MSLQGRGTGLFSLLPQKHKTRRRSSAQSLFCWALILLVAGLGAAPHVQD
jgi:hypothetical protein